MNDIKELISGCLRGDVSAQQQLFSLFGPKMLGICRRYCSNIDDAHDALQEGFIKVLQTISKYRGESQFETWMTRIFINTAIDHFKKSLRYADLFTDVADNDKAEAASEVNFGFPCSPEEALRAMDQLPPGYRIVFNLYALEGFTHKQIAAELGISEGTSKSQYARARKTLQDLLTSKVNRL